MNVAERRLKLLLRVVGVVSLPAVVAVFMPHSWLVRGVELAEPGTAVRVLMPYLARLVSVFYFGLGYRLQLVEASWPSALDLDSTLQFSAKWRNAGVAPCLPGGYPALTLKDSKGGIVGIVGVFVDDRFDVRLLPIGAPGKAKVVNQEATFTVSPLLYRNFRPGIREPGTYEIYISVGTRTGTPRIALPLPESDGKRRYRLGMLKIVSAKEK